MALQKLDHFQIRHVCANKRQQVYHWSRVFPGYRADINPDPLARNAFPLALFLLRPSGGSFDSLAYVLYEGLYILPVTHAYSNIFVNSLPDIAGFIGYEF